MDRAIGVDIGGTQTRVAAVARGRVLTRKAFPTEGMREVVEAVGEVLQKVGWHQPETIGVGAPGPVDMRRGKVLALPNLPSWAGVEVVRELEEALGCAAHLANDATCGAIGELEFGYRAHDFVYLTWSTGIGGGIVSGGRVVWGATGQAGEVGHMVLEPAGPPCGCGKKGCLEALAGGASLARQGSQALGQQITARTLVDLARAGDVKAQDLVAQACRALGHGIAILWEVLEPELVVVGGGLSRAWDFLGPKVLAAAQEMSRTEPQVERTRLGDDVGLLGAAELPTHLPPEWRSS